ANNGLCFERLPDGKVRVALLRAGDLLDRDPGITIGVMEISVFASAVASMSARGETAETFIEAERLLRE
ncbi:MAG TPA: hypothetical protein VMX74_09060, partial [Pirellulales bacterium]|nr:hypothetical protein [Pirellulales bacterium]